MFRTRSSMQSALGGSDKLVMAWLVWKAPRAGGRVSRRCGKYIVSSLTSAALMGGSVYFQECLKRLWRGGRECEYPKPGEELLGALRVRRAIDVA